MPVASTAAHSSRTASHVAPRAGTVRAAGQLPTFERTYLVDELRRIAMTSGALLAVIVVLKILIR